MIVDATLVHVYQHAEIRSGLTQRGIVSNVSVCGTVRCIQADSFLPSAVLEGM